MGHVEGYCHLVGKLNYFAITCPDISWHWVLWVNLWAMAGTSHPQWVVVLQIEKYLKAYPNYGILYKANDYSGLETFIFQLGKIHPQREGSTTGYCTFLRGNLITWIN